MRVDAVDGRIEAGGARDHDEVRTGVERLQVAVGGAEVTTQVDAAQREMSHAGRRSDLLRGEDSTGALDGADQRRVRRPVADPLNVLSGLDFGDSNAGGEARDGLKVGGGKVGAYRIDANPGRAVGENIGDHRAR